MPSLLRFTVTFLVLIVVGYPVFARCPDEILKAHQNDIEVARKGSPKYLIFYRIHEANLDFCNFEDLGFKKSDFQQEAKQALAELKVCQNDYLPVCERAAAQMAYKEWISYPEYQQIADMVKLRSRELALSQNQRRCPPSDFRSKLPPVWDQSQYRETDWCYGYSAAALASYELGKEISPEDLASAIHERSFPQVLAKKFGPNHNYVRQAVTDQNQKRGFGGYSSIALHGAVLRGGFCERKHFDTIKFDESQNPELRREWEKLQSLTDDLKKCNGDCECTNDLLPQLSPLASDVLNIVDRYYHAQVSAHLAEQMCKGKRLQIPKDLKICDKYRDINNNLAKEILRPRIKTQPIEVYLKRGSRLNHSVTIVGRQLNLESGLCEYIVRDSGGMDCKNIQLYPYEPKPTCKDGHFFIEDELLERDLAGVSYFAKKCD